MSGADFLFGGTATRGRGRKRRNPPGGETAPKIGVRFILLAALVGACFSGLGYWKVNTVFAVRDHEIETHRLQEITRERRDRHTVMTARISQLQRGEILRAAAADSLGMTEPDPRAIEVLVVPSEITSRWMAAANAAGQAGGKER